MDTLAFAACAFELANDNAPWIQILPAGAFKPNDGRKMDVPHWFIDGKSAAALIDKFRAQKNPLVIDYEHQTLHKEHNGQPAPAAAWMTDLEWREGSGLWAKTEYTPIAREQVKSGQYRYFSPVFAHDKKGVVKDLINGAFTNSPAIDGMARLAALARQSFVQSEDVTMPETPEKPADLSAIAAALNLDKSADEQAIIAACGALKAQSGQAQAPDPAQYVPVATMHEMQAQMAALAAQVQGNQVEGLISAATAQGKLLPAQAAWARDYGAKDLEGLKNYLENAPIIAALTRTQASKPPKDTLGLTAEDRIVAAACGMTDNEFAVAKGTATESQDKEA